MQTVTVWKGVFRRENVIVHLRFTGTDGFPLVDIKTNSANQS